MTGTVQLMTTVLPHSVDPGADFHVSLFFTHRLTPGDTNTLADVAALANWVALLKNAQISLQTDAGTVACTPILTPLSESAWHTAFPGTTPVRDFPKPLTSQAPWKSYPANRLPEHALAAHYASVFSSPVTRPGVDASRLAQAVLAQLRDTIATTGDRPNLSRTMRDLDDYAGNKRDRRAGYERGTYDQAGAAVDFTLPAPPADPPAPPPHIALHLTEEVVEQPWRSPIEAPLDACDTEITDYLDSSMNDSASVEDPALAMVRDAHMTQRFYHRTEEQTAPKPSPTPGVHEPRPTPVVPDFHARAATVGSTPALARQLGFVLDLKVSDLDKLAAATLICCDVTVPGVGLLVGPATRCVVSGTRFLAAPETDSWVDGFLAVGRPDRYRVMDLDPDASGFKLEQLLRGVVRAYATELNGDSTSYAPGTLRSSGFSIAHIDRPEDLRTRVEAAEQLQPQVAAGEVPIDQRTRFGFEQLARGFRVEVWDDATRHWHSLHERRVDADFQGAPLLSGTPDTGYLQNTPMSRVPGNAANPYYVHEVIAGWDGWSLAAPRPGLAIVHDSGQDGHPGSEVVKADQERPSGAADGIGIRGVAAPNTLPALRYGRSYSFRVLGVDLAGNSVDHRMDVSPVDPADPAVGAATMHLAGLREATDARDAAGLLEQQRKQVMQQPPPANAHIAKVENAVSAIEVAAQRLTTRPQLDVDPAHFAGLFATESSDPNTVTTPRLFLRWEAVLPPTVVPRNPYTLGESLNRLVIRDSVDGSVTSQRHLVPAKSTQLDAELDGCFDALMTSANPDDRRRAYATALKERGSLFDIRIQSLDDPSATVDQPGVSLQASAGADPRPFVTPEQLQDHPEVQPAEGQYVVHDVDTLVLPYLPDSMADGVALVFYRAGAGHHLRTAQILQSVVIPFAGQWPNVEPLRLVVHGAPVLHAEQDGNVIDVGIPPGEQVAVAVSTTLDKDHLDRLGLWRFHAVHDPKVADADRILLERAALDGWLWWLTPSIDLRLVHATARPAVPPAITALTAVSRQQGVATAELVGTLRMHSDSTERAELHATWTDIEDDVSKDAAQPVQRTEIVSAFTVGPDETDSLVFTRSNPPSGTRDPGVPVRPILHTMPDTRFRTVDYRLYGSSRYREFFDAAELPAPNDEASAGNTVRVTHLNSAPPLPPQVHDVVPMFLWEEDSEPEQPFARRRTRRSGVRIWLDRPWFSSGDGELLAVIVGPDNIPPPKNKDATLDSISLWGRDPAFVTPGARNSTDVHLVPAWQQRALQLQLDPQRRPGRPVGYKGLQFLQTDPDLRSAYLYQPEYHHDRKRWFVDVLFDAADTAWPFVRLTLARFQPNSILDCFVSPTVTTDFVQLLPERIATLSRPEADQVRVTVSGATAFTNIPGIFGTPNPPPDVTNPNVFVAWALPTSRQVVATLQSKDPGSDSDLGWTKVEQVQCTVEGARVVLNSTNGSITELAASWSGVLQLDPANQLRTPGTVPELRVLVEEYEMLPADPESRKATISRLIYADHLYL
ncbi:hypothetical protein IU450_28100 [Nocardia abscessus]|uniref:hypothetical protein n=1 Tax=Nocardia abscessus TaxID=120957 RepID=UPI001892F29F|nr:hypothetical protein [Nocardia abscessus]MBF6339725.1 hypothetical protein [Nocardia abscessus]